MNALDDILKNAHRARLIPTVADSRKEERIVSVLLATLSVVPPFAEQFLERCGVRMGKTSALRSYTEVEFMAADGSSTDRPDGVLSLLTRQSRWTALLEAKIDNTEISEEQVHRYAEIAREYGIDAVITLSNQLASLPSHVPYSVPKRLSNRVQCFHISWISVLTQAALILRDDNEVSRAHAFILEEMARYFEHPSSGIKRFDQMNTEWRALVLGVRTDQQFKRTSSEIENTVASWHQEERDVCLILSRRIGARVGIRLLRKHQMDPALRLRDVCDALIASQELRCAFSVPNAASDLDVIANLQRRTISCSMKLTAPGDKKSAGARVNWLVRQLRGVEGDDVIVRAFWLGRGGPTQATLSELKTDPKCLESGHLGAAPTSFEVVMIRDLAGRFSGRRTFIEDLENLIPEFYDRIGQNLRPWAPPPPSIDRRDPIQAADTVDASEERTGDGVAQSESDHPHDPQALGDAGVPLAEEPETLAALRQPTPPLTPPSAPSDEGPPSAGAPSLGGEEN